MAQFHDSVGSHVDFPTVNECTIHFVFLDSIFLPLLDYPS